MRDASWGVAATMIPGGSTPGPTAEDRATRAMAIPESDDGYVGRMPIRERRPAYRHR